MTLNSWRIFIKSCMIQNCLAKESAELKHRSGHWQKNNTLLGWWSIAPFSRLVTVTLSHLQIFPDTVFLCHKAVISLLVLLYWIDHFTVVCLVTWPLNGNKVEGDLVLIQTRCFSCVNQVVLMLTRCIYTTKTGRSVSKQGHLQPCCHSKARFLAPMVIWGS